MRKRKIFGWGLFCLGVLFLAVSVLKDHHIYLGAMQFLYDFFDWFSIESIFDLIFESFESVFDFIGDYFWCLFLIVIGISLVFGAKKQQRYDEDQIYSSYHEVENESKKHRTICRNLDDMKLAGVCSGIAYLFSVDPTIIRIVVLFIGFVSGGSVFFAYILLALLLPGEHLG